MSARRVAVTGLGVICALGNNASETWNAVSEGRSGIAPIHSIDLSKLRFRNGAQVRRYDPCHHFEASRVRLLDPCSQFLIIAAREALTGGP
jgi:nodulation protein E